MNPLVRDDQLISAKKSHKKREIYTSPLYVTRTTTIAGHQKIIKHIAVLQRIEKSPTEAKSQATLAFSSVPSGSEDSDLSSSDDQRSYVAAEHRLIFDEQQEEPVVRKVVK
jgi:hypothetical protein